MTGHLLEAYREDIKIRLNGKEPANPEGYKIKTIEISEGLIFKDDKMTVKAFRVHHGDWENAFGFRFEGPDRIIVISGDRSPLLSIADAARGCDILVHEVYSLAGFKTRTPEWKAYHADAHTSSVELARMASEIRPKLLVLTHQLLWGTLPEDLLKEIGASYNGPVVYGKDLDIY